ncbi:LacI family DNA-binding transcriptional regulator [Colwellia hornerae]|uniref:LacI family transcriptional regulator n=1 Tax=Colwellia hornerae TaxID=89402 RepID=A0A5C6QJA5_9GAMM|nr:LacI family DNA-binding transcriptional regulator [Colwellia hornerae]TWX53352.1 LacI family transcriptional regulator [Colwellia hornerae]TWX60172.1 LacI family transcriptional regulator [Colwellia hornerae]TWX69034.1 LacI family transcriptional regulator [Colwellia hornerae]
MAKNKKVTSYDVAREAGVSQSAVSRVFRPGLSVSQKTRDKVMTAANRMGYRPNAIARMLITKQSGMVAVIVSSRANVNYPEVLSQVSKQLAAQNKRVLLFTLDDPDGVDELFEQIWTFQVDGVIALAAHFESHRLAQFEEHDIPVVLYNRNVPDSMANTVCCNHELGIKQLITELEKNNPKKYLVLSGPKDSDVANERREIAISLLKQFDVEDVSILYGDYSYQSGRDCLAKWLQKNPAPDAIICSNDTMAIGVIDEARENHNIHIPNDISVVGFDGITSSAWLSYQITTIKQPVEQLVKAAVAMLLERIETPDLPPEARVLTGVLIKGNSVKRP